MEYKLNYFIISENLIGIFLFVGKFGYVIDCVVDIYVFGICAFEVIFVGK